MEKRIDYVVCENGNVDIVVNINGKDEGNYCYCNLEAVKRDYPESEYIYNNLEE